MKCGAPASASRCDWSGRHDFLPGGGGSVLRSRYRAATGVRSHTTARLPDGQDGSNRRASSRRLWKRRGTGPPPKRENAAANMEDAGVRSSRKTSRWSMSRSTTRPPTAGGSGVVCPRTMNGSTARAPARPHGTTGETRSTAVISGTGGTRTAARARSARSARMPGVCTMWKAMSGNGRLRRPVKGEALANRRGGSWVACEASGERTARTAFAAHRSLQELQGPASVTSTATTTSASAALVRTREAGCAARPAPLSWHPRLCSKSSTSRSRLQGGLQGAPPRPPAAPLRAPDGVLEERRRLADRVRGLARRGRRRHAQPAHAEAGAARLPSAPHPGAAHLRNPYALAVALLAPLPNYGQMAIFDRSWYGRVLEERVEKISRRSASGSTPIRTSPTSSAPWPTTATSSSNSSSTSARRNRSGASQERKAIRWQAWHVQPEDWEHHRQYDEYLEAVEEMLEKTDTEWAPWTMVEATDRRWARVKVFEAHRGARA